MKLSELIRKGSERAPQCYGDYAKTENGRVVGLCALGAAYYAATGFVPPAGENASYEIGVSVGYDIMRATPFDIPEGLEMPITGAAIHDAIVYLNDDNKWTREQIAEWLEGQGL